VSGRLSRGAFVVAVLVASPSAWSAKYFDADNIGEAVSMMSVEMGFVEEARKYCGQNFPKAKRVIDYHALMWTSNNAPEVSAVASYRLGRDTTTLDSVRDAAVATGMTMLKGVALIDRESACGGFVQQLKQGERDVANRTPKASAFLREYLVAHPLPALETSKQDMYIGCIKGLFNRGTDYDDAMPVCECNRRVFLADLTPEERAGFERHMADQKTPASYPPVQRILPKLVECAKPLAAKQPANQ
jgi:hypothetical protein